MTGACGVVGSCYARSMLDRGDSVIGLDSCEEPRNRWTAAKLLGLSDQPSGLVRRVIGPAPGISIRFERMEQADLSEALDCDVILHAAASTGIPHSANDPNDDWVSNVDATRHLLETLRTAKALGRRVPPTVVLSSVKPYRVDVPAAEGSTKYTVAYENRMPSPVGVDENAPLEPDEPYAASKMAQSALAQAYARSYDLPIVTFRCSNLYGPAPCHGPRHGWLTWFCISAVLGRDIEIQGSGKQTRDMLFTDDVTSAVLAALDKLSLESAARASLGHWTREPPYVTGEVFNLGGGAANTLSLWDAVEAIRVLNGRGPELTTGPGRRNEDMLFVTETSKFRRATAWRPLVDTTQGIAHVLTWATTHKADLARIYEGV